MKEISFPLLKASEIEVRIGTFNKDKSKCSLLLYKTARVDANVLDKVVGQFNWQKKFYELKGNIYCSVGIYDDERKEWVWKDDCGKESQTEAEKGEASDAFKRAGFAWGIGRELYTAPMIWVDNNGGYYECSKIEYKDGEISYVEIINTKTKEVVYPSKKAPTSVKKTQETSSDRQKMFDKVYDYYNKLDTVRKTQMIAYCEKTFGTNNLYKLTDEQLKQLCTIISKEK